MSLAKSISDCNTAPIAIVEIIKDTKRVDVFIEEFRKDVYLYLSFRVDEHSRLKLEPKSISLYWSEKDKILNIFGPFGDDGAVLLNADERAKAHVAKSLKKHYRYEGAFEFENMPF